MYVNKEYTTSSILHIPDSLFLDLYQNVMVKIFIGPINVWGNYKELRYCGKIILVKPYYHLKMKNIDDNEEEDDKDFSRRWDDGK